MGIFTNIKKLVDLGAVAVAEIANISGRLDQVVDGIELLNSEILTLTAAVEELKGVAPQDPVDDEEPVEEPPVDPVPSLDLVEMVEDCAFYEVDYLNSKGKPVMKGILVGYKATVGERYLVESQIIAGDSSIDWYRIWIGMNEDTSVRGHYIKKSKTKPA